MITKLYLRNFKCFEEQEFPMAPLTLLTGINGMGKSSVIQALLLLRQSWEIQEGLNGFDDINLEKLYLNGIYTNIGNINDIIYRNYSGTSAKVGKK